MLRRGGPDRGPGPLPTPPRWVVEHVCAYILGAYRPVMDSAAAFTRPPPPAARPEHLLRDADHVHHRTLAFWDSFDANGQSRERWTDAAIAASRAGAGGRATRPGAGAADSDGNTGARTARAS